MIQLSVRNLFIFLALVVVVTTLFMHKAGAFSIREFLGLEPPGTEVENTVPVQEEAPEEQTEKPLQTMQGNGFTADLDFNELQKIVSVVDENQRKIILADEESFRNFIENEAANKSVLSAAHANNIDKDERNLFIVRRGTENIIREIYLKKLIASKIPAGFPSAELMRNYFEENKDRFVLEERVHVWQIFLTHTDSSNPKEVELLKKQAETIITDINKNKTDFDTAARKYSDQPASKYAGGYMGLIKISELKPAIKDPLLSLEPGKISAPINTEEGIHILKRGNIVPQQVLAFDEVKDQIRQLLDTQLHNQLRQAIYKQASETYPVDIKDKTIEEWRLKLRTNISPANTTSAR